MAMPRSQTVPVLGSWMHYREVGTGRPVLLLHGNPTSSFLWRHVLRHAQDRENAHRWIAADLIGMGLSGKPDLGYRLSDHIAHVDAFIRALGLSDLVLVGHDWGVAIALDRLRRFPQLVRGVAFMEGHLGPLSGWEAFDAGGRQLFQRIRTPRVGEQLVLDDNFFLDTLLPAALTRVLTEDELDAYRAPYPDPVSRRPLLQWAREIPVAGEPRSASGIMSVAARHLEGSAVPKMLLHADPGVIVPAATVTWCRTHLTQLTTVDVGGPAGHFLPEDRPDEVADALIEWVDRLP